MTPDISLAMPADRPAIGFHRFGIPLFIILYAVLAIGGPIIFAVYDYYRTTGEAEEHVERQAQRLGRETADNVHAVDQALFAVIDIGRTLDPSGTRDGEALRRLQSRAEGMLAGDGLALVARDGKVLATSPEAERIAGAARQAAPAQGLTVETTGARNTWPVETVSMTRVTDDGIRAVAIVATRELLDLPDLVLWEEAGSASVWTRSGQLLGVASARSDATGAPTFPLDAPGAEAEPTNGGGRIETADDLAAWLPIANTDLIVTASLDRSMILWPWYIRCALVVLASLVLTAKAAVVYFLMRSKERERLRMTERLARAERLEALGSMAGGIAHDFRNFLMLCASLSQRLGREVGEAAQPTVRQMESALERGQSLARSLTSFARSGDFSLHEANPGALIRSMEPLLRQACGQRIDLRIQTAPDLWTCGLDPGQFDSAIVNLVVNARAAMPDGGRITIDARNVRGRPSPADPFGDYVLVSVEDTGQGMSSGVLKRAGEPYFTTKGESGSGIGLSQSFSFVRRIGGNLSVDSEEGKGTRVTLALRRFRVVAPGAARATAERPA